MMEQEAAAFAARLEGLEVHLAHISKANEDLSDMVAQHQKDLAHLARMVEMLAAREAEREAQGAEVIADAPPPHY